MGMYKDLRSHVGYDVARSNLFFIKMVLDFIKKMLNTEKKINSSLSISLYINKLEEWKNNMFLLWELVEFNDRHLNWSQNNLVL